jgi:hypothetical protein
MLMRFVRLRLTNDNTIQNAAPFGSLYMIHGGKYTGPSYEQEFGAHKAALDELRKVIS